MNYLSHRFSISPFSSDFADLLASELVSIGYESFIESEEGIQAYIVESAFDQNQLDELLRNWIFEQCTITLQATEKIASRNWNEEWEKNFFQPIIIGEECIIRSTFHTDVPQAKYTILIDPKMSFGTGHHETTSLMISEMLQEDLNEKSFLDMGCGTAVLAILAHKKGAMPICAIDIDEWAYSNSIENCRINQADSIHIRMGGAELLDNEGAFDCIFANINRNILLRDMSFYVEHLSPGGVLFMSGFYEEDLSMIQAEAERLGLNYNKHVERNRWIAVRFTK